MRYMNWDYPALLAAPMDVIDEIVEQMIEQAARR